MESSLSNVPTEVADNHDVVADNHDVGAIGGHDERLPLNDGVGGSVVAHDSVAVRERHEVEKPAFSDAYEEEALGPDPLTKEELEEREICDKRFGVGVYRRTLQGSCVGYSSPEGQKIMREAIKTKYMNIHYSLMEQFHTQSDPFFCGFGTLTNVLNSLQVDPGRKWRLGWRWYDESMIQTCVSLKKISSTEEGIDFEQFLCAAKTNHLEADAVRVTAQSSIDHFRQAVKLSCRSTDTVLVCSYARATMLQTGSGHFVPIGGYHKRRDLILILDVARYKLPPHWVPVKLMWQSMQELDQSIGLPRGYALIRKNMEKGRVRLLHNGLELAQVDTCPHSVETETLLASVRSFDAKWKELLAEFSCSDTHEGICVDPVCRCVEQALIKFVRSNFLSGHPCLRLVTLLSPALRDSIRETRVFRALSAALASLQYDLEELDHGRPERQIPVKDSLRKLLCLKLQEKAQMERNVEERTMLFALFMIGYPYPEMPASCNGYFIEQYTKKENSIPGEFINAWLCQYKFIVRMLRHARHEARFEEKRS